MHQSPFTKVGPNKKTCQLCHTLTPTDYKLWWQCFLQFGDDIVFQMFCCDILEPHFGGMFAHIGTLCHASHFPPGSTCPSSIYLAVANLYWLPQCATPGCHQDLVWQYWLVHQAAAKTPQASAFPNISCRAFPSPTYKCQHTTVLSVFRNNFYTI